MSESDMSVQRGLLARAAAPTGIGADVFQMSGTVGR
jgi:hypothetical protein